MDYVTKNLACIFFVLIGMTGNVAVYSQGNPHVSPTDIGYAVDPPDQAIWYVPGRLTISFAEDGTDIAGHPSTLKSSFSDIVTESELEDLLIEAFQCWAELSSINVGVVDDHPEVPFGDSQSTQVDGPVGDIRVGAVPMAGDVFAVAVPHNELLSGSWSGTLLFNSQAKFQSAEQMFAVALHEAGHVFGLEHTANENAVMHPTALNMVFDPQDIEELQDLYGTRILDPNDFDGESNDNIETAATIRNNGSVDGAVPTVAFGDLSDDSDLDFFVVRNRDYTGPITFRLINRAISSSNLRMTVSDENGQIYLSETGEPFIEGTGDRGDDISLTIPTTIPNLEYFVKIELAPGSKFSFGTYAIVTTFDQKLINPDAAIEAIPRIIRRNYNFVEQDQIQELFCQDEPCGELFDVGLNDEIEGMTNDTFQTATKLEPLIEFFEENRYRVIASLQTDRIDIDYYRVTAPDDCDSLTVNLSAIETNGPITKVSLLDSMENEIPGKVFVNGNGHLLIRFTGLTSASDYVFRVAADSPDVFATGNYQLDLTFCSSNIRVKQLARGVLSNVDFVGEHSLYVARSQLFHFSLSSQSIKTSIPDTLANSTIWMSIYDEEGIVVYRVAARLNDVRSSRSVILRPGSYAIRVSFSRPANPSMKRMFYRIHYVIEGEGVSDPTGPEIIDASDDPFAPCDKLSNQFCYPGGIMSSDPFIIVDGEETQPQDPPEHPEWQDSNIWYWAANWLG